MTPGDDVNPYHLCSPPCELLEPVVEGEGVQGGVLQAGGKAGGPGRSPGGDGDVRCRRHWDRGWLGTGRCTNGDSVPGCLCVCGDLGVRCDGLEEFSVT